MLQTFYPGRREHSAYEINYEEMYKKGYRGIIFDIDNTLVPHGAPADKRAVELFRKLRAIGFSTCLISNNKEPRVKPFADAVSSIYIYDAHKPSTKNYLAAAGKMGTDKENTFFVGDQIFTDVWGANRAGMYTILTVPIHPKEEIQIVLKRHLERIVLWSYERNMQNKHKDFLKN